MKPVVSSLVALVIAVAPLTVMAKPAHHSKSAHAAKVQKAEKTETADKSEKTEKADKSDKSDKSEKADKSSVVRVKAGKKDGVVLKPVLHHAHNVDLSGAGHKEPKSGHGSVLAPVSLTTKVATSNGKLVQVKSSSKDMPKLPNPNAGKPSKGGAEKGARKSAEKKSEGGDANDGEPTRDEETAELVARIRGRKTAVSSSKDASETPPPDSDKDNGGEGSRSAKVTKGTSRNAHSRPCVKEPVEIVRGPEVDRFELTKCDGTVAPLAIERLSILIRPGAAARPVLPVAELAKKPGVEIAHGIRRVDPRLIDRIQSIVDHFGTAESPAKLFVISGYRPQSVGSMHSSGRAIDFRVEGARNEDVVSFCKTLDDTGCGFYPNSSFVHLDIRDAGAGHVTWIDASGPGETPRYVSVWPPPVASQHVSRASATEALPDLASEGETLLRARRPDHESAPETVDDHDADVAR